MKPSLDLVADGRAQLGLTSPFVLQWARDGKFAFEGKQHSNLRVLVMGLDSYFFAAVARKDAPFDSLKDIKDKKLKVSVATQERRTLGDYGGGLLLDAYGLSYDEIIKLGGQVTHTSSEVIGDNMRDGRIDVDLEFFNLGHPMITEIATLTPIKFLPVEPEIVKALQEKYGFEPVLLPANSFPGQNEDVQLVGSSTAIFCRDDMADDVAYALTKAIVDNFEYLQKSLGAFANFTPEKAPKFSGGIEFHPGAIKYYKEKGLM